MNRRKFLGAASILGAGTLLGLPGFAHAAVTRESRVMMGTFVDVTLADSSSMRAVDAINAAFAEAARLERIFSRFDSGTPVAELNRAGRLEDAPDELLAVLAQASRCRAATGGAFDVTVQPVVDYLRSRRTPRGRIRIDEAEFAAVRKLVDATALRSTGRLIRFEKSGMGLTLDGIAKGYVADCMGRVLLGFGVENYLINAGGDIVAHGSKAYGEPWKIAVESPFRKGNYPASLFLSNGAVATSGGYENAYDGSGLRNHLVDPVSGESPLSVSSVTVKAPTAVEADALATAISVMPAPAAVRLIRSWPHHECFIIMRGGQVFKTGNWQI